MEIHNLIDSLFRKLTSVTCLQAHTSEDEYPMSLVEAEDMEIRKLSICMFVCS